jgi:tetratricopeptide (TPR) repeat protein
VRGASQGGRAGRAVEETAAVPDPAEALPPEVLGELRNTVRPNALDGAARVLATAVVALSEEDIEEAVRAASAAKRVAPRSAATREVLGVALYQMGDYRAARTELAAAQRLSGSTELSAMLADIERALGRPERAVALFDTVDRARMQPDTAAELLVVAASAYGDLGQPAAGVALLRRHARWPAELSDHHLRLAYAEGALAEQAGDVPGARKAFTRVVEADPSFYDAAERLERLPAG